MKSIQSSPKVKKSLLIYVALFSTLWRHKTSLANIFLQ